MNQANNSLIIYEKSGEDQALQYLKEVGSNIKGGFGDDEGRLRNVSLGIGRG